MTFTNQYLAKHSDKHFPTLIEILEASVDINGSAFKQMEQFSFAKFFKYTHLI